MPSTKKTKEKLRTPLPCFVCDKKFSSVAILIVHIDTHHPSTTLYRCVICHGDTNTLQKYRRHILGHIKAHNNETIQIDNIIRNVDNHCNYLNNNPDQNLEIIQNQDLNTANISLNNHDDLNLDHNNPMDIDPLPVAHIIDDNINNIYNTCLKNLLTFCSHPDMTFKRAFEFSSIKNQEHIQIIDALKNIIDMNDNSNKEVLKKIENTFNNFNTEYLFTKHLEELGLYSPPMKVIVGSENRSINVLGINEFQEIKDSICILDFKFMLKSLFECQNFGEMVLNKINDYLNNNDGKIRNFVQGKIWRDIVERNPNKTLVPYFFYDDDIEIASPVGHNVSKQSLSVYTIHFPVVEDFLLSKTELMFPVAIAKTTETKKYLKDYVINTLVETMNELAEEGILLKIGNEERRIYFILGLVIGDNKALNEMLGFTGSFIHEFCCRQCIMPIEDRSVSVQSDPSLKRNIEDYDDHLNNSDEFGKYGLNRKCNLNKIYEFHAYRNFYSDIFHDVIYSVMKDGLEALVQDGIKKKKFSVEDLKRDFNLFDYGQIDSGNKLDHSIFDNKGKLRLTGKEYTLFLKYFTLVLGHYYDVNKDEDIISLNYIYILEDLFYLCNAEYFDKDRIALLKQLVSKHHRYYLDHIPEEKIRNINGVRKSVWEKSHLKYKQHNGTHYDENVENSGPLKYMSTIRLESHLRDVKKYANATPSRINLPYTIGKKYSMKFALFLKKYNDSDFQFIYKSSTSKLFKIDSEPYKSNLRFSDVNLNNFMSYKQIDFKGTSYRSDNTQYVLLRNSLENIYKVLDVIAQKANSTDIFLAVEQFNIDHFDEHYNAHVIGNTNKSIYIYNIEKFGMPLNIITLSNRKKVFKINKYNYT